MIAFAYPFPRQGLGKTATVIVYAYRARLDRILVFCPNTIASVWQTEFDTWWPGRSSHVVASTDTLLPDVNVLLVPYHLAGLLRKRSRLLKKYGGDAVDLWPVICSRSYDLMVADEAHNLRNPETARVRAIHAIAARIPRRLLLTGTPFVNSSAELFTTLRLLLPRGRLCTVTQFEKLFRRPDARYDRDFKVLLDALTIRRLKCDTNIITTEKHRRYVLVDADQAVTDCQLHPRFAALARDLTKTAMRWGPPRRFREDMPIDSRLSLHAFVKGSNGVLRPDLTAEQGYLMGKGLDSQRQSTYLRLLEDKMQRTLKRTPEQRRIWGPARWRPLHRTRWMRENQALFGPHRPRVKLSMLLPFHVASHRFMLLPTLRL